MATVVGFGGDEAAQETEDRAMQHEIGERRESAGVRAQALEAEARRWRNIEAACAAALETLEAGFQNQAKIAELESQPKMSADRGHVPA